MKGYMVSHSPFYCHKTKSMRECVPSMLEQGLKSMALKYYLWPSL